MDSSLAILLLLALAAGIAFPAVLLGFARLPRADERDDDFAERVRELPPNGPQLAPLLAMGLALVLLVAALYLALNR